MCKRKKLRDEDRKRERHRNQEDVLVCATCSAVCMHRKVTSWLQWCSIYLDVCVSMDIIHTHTPVCIERRYGLHSTWVQRLRLLQQDVLHQPSDVHVDVAGEAVHAGRVGSYSCQEVRGTGYLLGGLVVIGHSHDDPGETCLTNGSYHQARLERGWTDGTLKLVKRAMAEWYYTLIRSAHSLLQGFPPNLFISCQGPAPSLFLSLTSLYLQCWPRKDQLLRVCRYSKGANSGVTGEIIISWDMETKQGIYTENIRLPWYQSLI